MIAFAACIGSEEKFRAYAQPGLQQAKRLVLLADMIDAAEAYSLGLVTWIQPGNEIDGFDHARAAQVGVPAILGLNFQSVSTAQKLPTSGGQTGGYQDDGLTPGPLLFSEKPQVVWPIIASMIIGNFMLLVLNVPLVGLWVRILKIPLGILNPLIVLFIYGMVAGRRVRA